MDRSHSLHQIRPEISIEKNSQSRDSEQFQNEVLRPILKFQHDFLCFSYLNNPSIVKAGFSQKHKDQQIDMIIDALKSNHKLKAEIIHAITSMMTIEELKHFHYNKSEYSKRIISMASQRLMDGLIS